MVRGRTLSDTGSRVNKEGDSPDTIRKREKGTQKASKVREVKQEDVLPVWLTSWLLSPLRSWLTWEVTFNPAGLHKAHEHVQTHTYTPAYLCLFTRKKQREKASILEITSRSQNKCIYPAGKNSAFFCQGPSGYL